MQLLPEQPQHCWNPPKLCRLSLRKQVSTIQHWCPVAGNAASHSPTPVSDLVACADPEICRKICGNPSGCSDIAYPKLVLELLPVGKSLVRFWPWWGWHMAATGVREGISERKITWSCHLVGFVWDKPHPWG